jgi:hypothetical protein
MYFYLSCTVFMVVENSVDTQSKYVIKKNLNIVSRLRSLVSSIIVVYRYFTTQFQTQDSRMINEFCILKVLHNEVLLV